MKKLFKGELQAAAFLNALYGNVQQGYMTLWSSKDKKTSWYKVNETKNLIKEAMRLRENSDVYFGVGVRKQVLGGFQRGKNSDVLCLPSVWLDIDQKGGNHSAGNLPTEEEVKCILDTFPLEPSIIIQSGGGIHCYWLFKKPMEITAVSEMSIAERMIARFQNIFIQLAREKGLHIDNTSDLARVLRLPGTLNLKSKMNPKPVTIQMFKPDRRFSFVEINEAIQTLEVSLPVEPKSKTKQKQYYGQIPNVTKPNRIIQECQFIRDYLKHREIANYNQWLAALSIAAYCENGEELVHEWSKGHPDYEKRVVIRKYNEIRMKMKPRTCFSIQREFGGCKDCRHFNKINSPIALGMVREKYCH